MGRRAAQHGVRCGRVGSETSTPNLLPSPPPLPPPFSFTLRRIGSDRICPTTYPAPPPQVSVPLRLRLPSPPVRRARWAPVCSWFRRRCSLAVGFCSLNLPAGNGSLVCFLARTVGLRARVSRIFSCQRTRLRLL
ncbi:unnamed protein product [Urochloa humidicola]